MIAPLMIGGLLVLVVLAGAWLYRSAPTHANCPECGEPTSAVAPPGFLNESRRVAMRRWCGACGWHGVGRSGPEWTPGRPISHDSGFAWGADRLPVDFGFRWSSAAEAERSALPHHPSGFRFVEPPSEPAEGPAPEHPSGFRWASDPNATGDGRDGPVLGSFLMSEDGGTLPGHPSGFRWGRYPADPAQDFNWKRPGSLRGRSA